MKRTVITMMAIMVIAVSAMASADLIKQKAKNIRDQNNAAQGVTPPSAPTPSPSAAPGNGPAQGGLSASQQALLDRLQAELTSVKLGTGANDAQKTRLEGDFAVLARGANKPSKASLTKLSNDLSAALKEKQLNLNQMTKLCRDLNIIMNCGALTSSQAHNFVTDAQNTLKFAGVSSATVEPLGNDLIMIVNEVQNRKSQPKLYE